MVQIYFSKMTDLLLAKDGVPRQLIIKKDPYYGVVTVEGATKVAVDFNNDE